VLLIFDLLKCHISRANPPYRYYRGIYCPAQFSAESLFAAGYDCTQTPETLPTNHQNFGSQQLPRYGPKGAHVDQAGLCRTNIKSIYIGIRRSGGYKASKLSNVKSSK
jgi:hypothetical protein